MVGEAKAYDMVLTTIVAVGAIALNPSNLPINLHLMHLVRQFLQALFVQLIDRQHPDIYNFFQR